MRTRAMTWTVAFCAAVIMATASWSSVTYAASAGLMAGLMQENSTTTPKTQDEVDDAVEDTISEAGGLVMNGGNVPIDLMDLFDTPPDMMPTGDDFEAESSDDSVVEVGISDNPHVVLTPRMAGMATITVRHLSADAMVMFEVEVLEMAPEPTPAVPLVGSGLLGLFLFAVGAWRRYRSA